MSENRKLESVDQRCIVRQGWRAFDCDECGRKWEWPSRDRFSPSGENCPDCGEWLFPHASRADETLPVDTMGNLLCSWNYEPNADALAPPPQGLAIKKDVPGG